MRRSALSWVVAAALLVGLQCTAPVLATVDFDDEYDEEVEEATVKSKGPKAAKKGANPTAGEGPSSALKMAAAPTEENMSEVTIPLEHSLGNGAFTPAGAFTALASLHTTTKVVRLTKVKVTRDDVSDATQKELVKLLDANGHYRVRVPGNIFGGNPEKYVMSSLPLRCLVNADLTENFVLQIDNLGNVVALDYSTHSGECIREETAPPSSWTFKPMVYHRLPKDAPRLNPDYYMNYQAPSSGRGSQSDPSAKSEMTTYADDTGPDGKKKPPPKTFFQKYWMYIVPVALIVINNIISPPETGKKK